MELTHRGGCHCGAVRFEVDAPAEIEVSECNCSICSRSGYLHLIVPRERFRLLRGEQELTTYRFGTGVARHLFCRTCGIKSFYAPRSHPDGISVNARCLDEGTVARTSLRHFDGRNWEQAARKRGYGASEARSEPTRGSASGGASEGRSPSASDERVRGPAKAGASEARSEPTRGFASGGASEGRSPSASDERVRGPAKS